MRRRTKREIIVAIALLMVIVTCIAIPVWTRGAAMKAYASGIAPLPLISSGAPAYSNGTVYSPSYANDSTYNTYFRSSAPSVSSPVWLAYDLSSVPVAERSSIVLAWYNDPMTGDYNYTVKGDAPYNEPSSYTIDANAAAGGGSVPASGWVTLVSATGESFHSRQFLLNFSGYNWVRMNVTSVDGASPNNDIAINMDVHDASAGTQDDWLFLGDSITRAGLSHTDTTFANLIHAANSAYMPVDEDGGIGGALSATDLSYMTDWLSQFPGQFVSLNFGTNDASGGMSPSTFQANMTTLVQDVLNAGKIPVIPTIPWANNATIQANAPGLNAVIQSLYTTYPSIIHGPDLWSFFQSNPSDISSDGVHPNSTGYQALRQQWANAMLSNVYSGTSPTPTPTDTPTPVPTCGG